MAVVTTTPFVPFVRRLPPRSCSAGTLHDVAAGGPTHAGDGLGVATLGMAVGYAVAGPLLDQYGARTTTYVTAVAILAIGTMWVGQARRHQGLRADHAADETIDTHIAEVRSHIG